MRKQNQGGPTGAAATNIVAAAGIAPLNPPCMTVSLKPALTARFRAKRGHHCATLSNIQAGKALAFFMTGNVDQASAAFRKLQPAAIVAAH